MSDIFLGWDILELIFKLANSKTKYFLTQTCHRFRKKIFDIRINFGDYSYSDFKEGDYFRAYAILWAYRITFNFQMICLEMAIYYHHKRLVKLILLKMRSDGNQGLNIYEIMRKSIQGEGTDITNLQLHDYHIKALHFKILILFQQYGLAKKYLEWEIITCLDIPWALLTIQSSNFLKYFLETCVKMAKDISEFIASCQGLKFSLKAYIDDNKFKGKYFKILKNNMKIMRDFLEERTTFRTQKINLYFFDELESLLSEN